MFGFLIWLIANYPNNPAERSRTDDCESIAEPNRQSQSKESPARETSTTVKHNETTPPDSARNEADNKIDTERQIAKYNCQLAIYTRDLAFFTKWLVYVTTGLIVIGLLQGYFLQRSVGIAQTAAIEARDAITATQASADAANAHARSAAEANKINREVLIAIDRPWISVRMKISEGEPVIFAADKISVGIAIVVKNIGKSPAAGINCRVELYPDLVAANQRIRRMDLREIPNLASGEGRVLFPDQEFAEEWGASASTVVFRKFLREAASAASAIEADTAETEPFNEGWPAVIAAVWHLVARISWAERLGWVA
jgi:hypothetical protein